MVTWAQVRPHGGLSTGLVSLEPFKNLTLPAQRGGFGTKTTQNSILRAAMAPATRLGGGTTWAPHAGTVIF